MEARLRRLAWILVKRLIHWRFPEVQSLSVETLATETLATGANPATPVLVDVRQAAEYAVSHLPGARHLPTVEAIGRAGIAPTANLVLYCSVGYRSARVAQQLQAAGYDRVMNLEGSIFEWYNRGYPLEDDRGTVRQVHPYNGCWGLLLEPLGR